MERNYIEQTIPFQAGDGLECNLVNVKAEKQPPKGPILVVHGAG